MLYDDDSTHMNACRLVNRIEKLIEYFDIYNDENKKIQLNKIRDGLSELANQEDDKM